MFQHKNNSLLKMIRLNFFIYLTLSVFMSSLFTVTASGKNIDSISGFLLGKKSGKIKIILN